jgi:hypothetical protein
MDIYAVQDTKKQFMGTYVCCLGVKMLVCFFWVLKNIVFYVCLLTVTYRLNFNRAKHSIVKDYYAGRAFSGHFYG